MGNAEHRKKTRAVKEREAVSGASGFIWCQARQMMIDNSVCTVNQVRYGLLCSDCRQKGGRT